MDAKGSTQRVGAVFLAIAAVHLMLCLSQSLVRKTIIRALDVPSQCRESPLSLSLCIAQCVSLKAVSDALTNQIEMPTL
jgi:hypothetical protein